MAGIEAATGRQSAGATSSSQSAEATLLTLLAGFALGGLFRRA